MIRSAIALCLTATAMIAAAGDSTKQDKSSAKTQTAKTAADKRTPITEIPKGAVHRDDNSYLYTDPQGKQWVYRETPFGIARNAYTPPVKAPAKADPTRAFESGDSIRFEKPTPFGTAKWTKKKTDLDPAEQKIWESQQSKK